MLTANSSHTTKNVARIARPPAIRYRGRFVRATTASKARQAAMSIPPKMMKSAESQFTSLVICMAAAGISNTAAALGQTQYLIYDLFRVQPDLDMAADG